MISSRIKAGIALSLLVITMAGCAVIPTMPEPGQIVAPEPREDSAGEFISPFTSDDVVAGWVEKGMNAKVGSAVGSYAGQKAMENVPFIGGFLGDKVGSALGKAAAIEMSGGMETMRATTDLSFDTVDDLILYTYANHSAHPDYAKVIKLVGSIYPDFQKRYGAVIMNAPVQATYSD